MPTLSPVPRAPVASRPTAARPPATFVASARPSPSVTSSTRNKPGADRARVGVGLAIGTISDYDWGDGLPGWYLAWGVLWDPPLKSAMRFAQTVRLKGNSFKPGLDVVKATAEANPGSLWLIGNEPDVVWQDNVTPEQYASSYGILYRAIKETDPTAQVAIGGVSQPTPLRMAYLDRILEAYRRQYRTEMPVDVWNVHAFILREERGSWGVGIPPGMPVDRGQLYEIGDHTDMQIFRKQIADFRRWMANRGLRNKPLIVSEYGVLMPETYGFSPKLVSQFMVDTFDYFLTGRDGDTGYPADDNRLVQAFCWFSTADTTYPTPNLFNPKTRAITPLGEVFRAYVAALK